MAVAVVSSMLGSLEQVQSQRDRGRQAGFDFFRAAVGSEFVDQVRDSQLVGLNHALDTEHVLVLVEQEHGRFDRSLRRLGRRGRLDGRDRSLERDRLVVGRDAARCDQRECRGEAGEASTHHRTTPGSQTANFAPERAVVAVVDADPPAVHSDVLGSQRKTEPGARARAAASPLRTASEPIEDHAALVHGHARPFVEYDDLDVVVALGDLELRSTTCVVHRVLDQVGDHPGQPPLVGLDHAVLDGGGVAQEDALRLGFRCDAPDELDDAEVLELEIAAADVVAGDLQEVADQLAEAVEVATEQIECCLGPFRELVAP